MDNKKDIVAEIVEAYSLVFGREVDDGGLQAAMEILSRNEDGLSDLYKTLLKSQEFLSLRSRKSFEYEGGEEEADRVCSLARAVYKFFLRRDLDSESSRVSEIINNSIDIREFITGVIESEEFLSLSRVRASNRALQIATKKQAFSLLEETVNSRIADLAEMKYSKEVVGHIESNFASMILDFTIERAATPGHAMEYE